MPMLPVNDKDNNRDDRDRNQEGQPELALFLCHYLNPGTQNKEAEDEASPVNSSDRLWRLHAEEHRTKEAEV
jgi:hypothetical protein